MDIHEQHNQFIERMKKARKAAGLSASQAATLMQTSPQTINMLESKALPFTILKMLKLCEIYGISPVWALTGVNPAFDREVFIKQMQAQGKSDAMIAEVIETLEPLTQ